MVFHKLLTDEERFWSRVDREGPLPGARPDLGPCWIWTGSTIRGYGQFQVGSRSDASRRMLKAHRFAYALERGPIAEGLTLDHLCRVTRCVRPSHLEEVTSAENTRRGESFATLNARKVSCPEGHPFDAMTKTGRRVCGTCRREATARWREAHPDRNRATWQASNAKRRRKPAA